MVLAPLLYGLVLGGSKLIKLFGDEEILFATQLSLKTSLASTVICIVLCLLSSSFLYFSKSKVKETIKTLLSTPMSLPHVVSGILLIFFFGNRGIGPYLEPFGLQFIFTVQGILLAQVVVNIPFIFEQLWAAFSKVDPKSIFVAKSLGANSLQLNARIIFPFIKNDIYAAILMCFSRCLGEYGAVMMIAGTTRMKTELLPTAVFLNMSTGNLDLSLAISFILIIFALLINLITRLALKRGEVFAAGE